MLFSVHHHFMASLGSNNFVLSLKVWIQKQTQQVIKDRERSAFLSSFLLLADADSEGNTRMEGVLNIQQNADNTEVWYLLPFKDYREVVLATFYSDGESIFKDVTDNYKKTYPHIKKVELQAICAIEELEPDK